jgi:excisionase family DNA binding protein
MARLTVHQAALLVPTSDSMVYQWVKEKRFDVLRVGGRGRRGRILIDEGVFRAFLESLTVEGDDESPPSSPAQPTPLSHHLRL